MSQPEGCICCGGHNINCPVHQTEEDREKLRAGFDAVFAMTPTELGQAAVEGARKWRGRPGPFTPRGCF